MELVIGRSQSLKHTSCCGCITFSSLSVQALIHLSSLCELNMLFVGVVTTAILDKLLKESTHQPNLG